MSIASFIRGLLNPEEHAIDKMALWGTGQDIGDPIHAGILVSQESALKLGVVWRCIRLISETLAGLPAEAIRKADGARLAVDRPAGWITMPNPEMTWFQFAERVFESQTMDGNAFILIAGRDRQDDPETVGFPNELWVLNPHWIEVKQRNGRKYFVWAGSTELSNFTPTNPMGDVLHIPLATAGGLRGLSPIEAAKQSIGLGLVTEKFGSRFFGKGQQMSGVIELPDNQPAKSRDYIELMRETWERWHSGSEQSHRPAILTGGAKWQGITIPPEDAQFLQTRAFQVEDIASRFYGIPPHLVGLTEKQTSWGTGVEQQGIGLFRFTLRGYIIRFEQAMSMLLPRGQFLRLDPRALLEADSKTEAEVLQMELQNGVISFDDWRAILDMPPRKGGNSFMVPLNMQIIPASGVVPAPAPAPTEQPSPNGKAQVPEGANP